MHAQADKAASDASVRGTIRPPLIERRYLLAFLLVACLFLSWALAASLNDVLIRQFRKALDLTRTQSSLIQFAFYAGYFCAALPAGLLIRRIGYKGAMLTGLGLYAAGALMFWPAAILRELGGFLVALYAIAIGLAFLETAANPYIAALGHRRTAAARLNLAQGFYGIGAVFGGLVGARFIFAGSEHTPETIAALPDAAEASVRAAEAVKVVGPYLGIAIAMALLMLLIAFARFPKLPSAEPVRRAGSPFRVLRDARLRWAVVAQFAYVGAQVGIWSFFIDYVKELLPGMSESDAALLFSANFVLLMIGRFTGASLGRRFTAAGLLSTYTVVNIALCVVAALAGGWVGVGALLATSFFMSIMYPTIFTLGIERLGEDTEFGASFLVMAIIGGALLPPLIAIVADAVGGVHRTMVIPGICFAICLAFAVIARRQAEAD